MFRRSGRTGAEDCRLGSAEGEPIWAIGAPCVLDCGLKGVDALLDRLVSKAAATMSRPRGFDHARATEACAVCHEPRSQGSLAADRDLFVCVECEEAADQLFAIQDAIWDRPEVDDAES